VRDTQVALSGIIAEAADYLVGRRVLSTEYRDGILWYQLSHDRLAFVVQAVNPQGPGAPGSEEPSTAHGMRAMARAAFNKGNLPAARRHAAEAIARYQAGDDWRGIADTRLVEADIARAAGDLLCAEQHLRSALSVFLMLEDGYSAARVLTALADLRSVVGDYAAAADLNRQAVERMPGDVTALTGLGYAQWQAGSPADAEATFGQVLRRESDAAMALVGRGQIRADLGRYDSALSDLDHALQSPLGRDIEADARSARALALAGLGRVAEARRELTASFQIDSDRPRSRLRAGRIAAILGERNEMRAEIERALSGRRPSLSSVERDSANRLLDSLR
jgi:tetratricopeptide (TPR) repeat protein